MRRVWSLHLGSRQFGSPPDFVMETARTPGSLQARVMASLAADDLLLARDLVASGRDDRELARACASGTLVRVWPGAYV